MRIHASQSAGLDQQPCILCASATAPSETFVRRHITRLNAGNTMTVTEQDVSSAELQRYGLAPNTEMKIYAALGKDLAVRRLSRYLGYGGKNLSIATKVWSFGTRNRIDWKPISYNLFEFGYIFVRNWDYALFSKKPFYVYFRGQDASRLLRDEKYVNTLKWVLPSATGAVFVAPTLIRNLEAAGIPVPQNCVIPSGVNLELFTPKQKDWKTFASVGRFVEKKGHDDTLRAFQIISRKAVNFRLYMIGDGPLLEEMKQLSHSLGIEEQVIFLGELDHKSISDTLNKAGFYIQSSKSASTGDSEGFPSAIQEALSSGCVVASTRHAGANDFLSDKQTALLSDEGDFEGMAANILEFLNNQLYCELMSSRARNLAESQFDERLSVQKFEEFVQRTL